MYNELWQVDLFDERLKRELSELPAGLVARFLRYAERMESYGPFLGMPHTRAMGGGLFELRLKAREGIARVFYCTPDDRRIVFLHVFVKKSRKTPDDDLEIARRRMKEVRFD